MQCNGDGAMTAKGKEERISHIPQHLRIKVLYEDEAIVVIEKPCLLRSVPGHANPPATSHANSPSRLSAQEAWMKAIESFGDYNEIDDDVLAGKWLDSLAQTTTNLVSVPRKWAAFRQYCHRNQRRLNNNHSPNQSCNETQTKVKQQKVDPSELDSIARNMYERIKKRQTPLLDLPEATSNEDSAFGQLSLLGYTSDKEVSLEESDTSCSKLYVVHRLDCEVSARLQRSYRSVLFASALYWNHTSDNTTD